ncbi:MAG: UDP-N-acetylmuramate dehydrogenase [Desulfobacterales bacterium]
MALSKSSKEWLQKTFGDGVRFDEPMNRHTYYRIGGPADALVTPQSRFELAALVTWCTSYGIPYRVLGNGSNILVKDGGIRGAVVDLSQCAGRIRIYAVSEEAVLVGAGGGVKLQRLCRYALKRGFGGMNFALGIPGTVGGAVRMNAGTQEGSIGERVTKIRFLLSTGKCITVRSDQLVFEYRRMGLANGCLNGGRPAVVLQVVFSLYPENAAFLKKEAEKLLENRRISQPPASKSAGCFFRNPASGISAGRLIDASGLKGYRVGDARVSPRHANFIINEGEATAEDVIRLMRYVQKRVSEKFNINLEPEVEIIGDETI